MKEPNTWTSPEPWTGYTVTIFPEPNKYGYTLKNAYKTEAGAIRAARKEMDGKPLATATIRKATIYKRTEKAELSISDPIKSIKAP